MDSRGLTDWPPIQSTDCVWLNGRCLARRGRSVNGSRGRRQLSGATHRRQIACKSVGQRYGHKRRPARRHLSARNGSSPSSRRYLLPVRTRSIGRRQITEFLSHGPPANSITLVGVQKKNVEWNRRKFVSPCFPFWRWRFRTSHRRSARH